MLFVCVTPLTPAIITLSGLTFQPFVQILLTSGLFMSFFSLDSLVDVIVVCVSKFNYLYGKIGWGINVRCDLWWFLGCR